MRNIKVIVEKHADGYVAYPLGLKGIVMAEGDSFDRVLTEIASAIQFHIETFGEDDMGTGGWVVEPSSPKPGFPTDARLSH